MTIPASLYGKVLNKDGVVGLIALMAVSFLMYVVYTGLQEQKTILGEIKTEAKAQTDVLKDIRYSLKASNGITFRNEP